MRSLFNHIISFIFIIGVLSCSGSDPIIENPGGINSPFKIEKINVQNKTFLKVESEVFGFINIFELEGQFIDHSFSPSVEVYPIIMVDEFGGHWNTFGECINGPFGGQKLRATNATFAYWYTWINLFERYSLNGVSNENEPFNLNDPEWNVSTDFVNEGAMFDAIPSIDAPVFENWTFKESLIDYDFLTEDDEVIVVSLNGETKVYPIKILDHHEIVNDVLGGEKVVISYAPYTGSPAVHKSNYKNEDYTFGVSGQVYMNNMLLFDRETFSFWSQLLNRVVTGALLDAQLEPVSFVQVKWNTWMNAADEYTILAEDQGFEKDYRTPKFDNYIANDTFIPFQVPIMDDTHLNKALFYGVSIDNEVLLYERPGQ